ncbi:MAG: hypothetical protein QXH91_00085, partial [Candidatus Bathyarchaeia archaeon]
MRIRPIKIKDQRFMAKNPLRKCAAAVLMALVFSLILSASRPIIAQKVVSPPILKKVFGGGLIQLAEGDHDIFDIAISYTKEGYWKGHFNYKMIRKNFHIILVSENITSMKINDNSATVQGFANRVDRSDKGLMARYSFNVIARDGGEKPGRDTLSVSIRGPNGFIHEISGTIKGQIVIMNEIKLSSDNVRGGKITIRSNSKIEKFLFYVDHGILNLTVSGAHETNGYMNITFKKETIDGKPIVTLDNKLISILIKSNETHHTIYFEYEHSSHNIAIYGTETVPIPEFGIKSIIV